MAAAIVSPAGGPSLAEAAARRGIRFGSAVTRGDLADAPLRSLLARECAIVTPGLEAKWAATEPQEGTFDWAPLDAIVGWADGARLALHLHTLVWAVYNPSWVRAAIAAGRGSTVMRAHIEAVCSHTRGRAALIDVVNEPVAPQYPSAPEGLCNTPWRRALGPGYVADAFRAAHASDPVAHLLINDDDLEYATPEAETKRRIYLRLFETWRRGDVPVDGLGLQAHLKPDRPFDDAIYRRFLAELAGLGLRLAITEFDVCDRTFPADTGVRDRMVAGWTRRFFDCALDERAVRDVACWGLSDRSTWMGASAEARRADGLPNRPLPYDAALRPKPMRDALVAALSAAPNR